MSCRKVSFVLLPCLPVVDGQANSDSWVINISFSQLIGHAYIKNICRIHYFIMKNYCII